MARKAGTRSVAEEREHKLAVSRGLLTSLESGPRAVDAARKFLGDDDLTHPQLRAELSALVESLKLPVRATSGKKGSFHGLHGREKAARHASLLPGAGTVTCPTCGAIKASADAWCPNGHKPMDASLTEDAFSAAMSDAGTSADDSIGQYTSHVGPDAAAALLLPEEQQPDFTTPPNLREATGWERCANCIYFDGSACNLYGRGRSGDAPGDSVHTGAYRVDGDDLCDSHVTLTPSPVQRLQEAVAREEKRLAEALSSGHGTEIEVARARLATARTSLREDARLTLPSLERVPGKQNWIEKTGTGNLPSYIDRIARHLHYEKGKSIGTAIAIAVNTVRRWCQGATVSSTGGIQTGAHVHADTRAKACKAVAEWEAKRAEAKAKNAAKKVAESYGTRTLTESEFGAISADFELARSLAEADYRPIPPSYNYAAKIIAEVEAAYDDWDTWVDGLPMAEAEFNPSLHPRGRGGKWVEKLGKIAELHRQLGGSSHIQGSSGHGNSAAPRYAAEQVARAITAAALKKKPKLAEGSLDTPGTYELDEAIGTLIASLDDAEDWTIEGPDVDARGAFWEVVISRAGGIAEARVNEDGSVEWKEDQKSGSGDVSERPDHDPPSQGRRVMEWDEAKRFEQSRQADAERLEAVVNELAEAAHSGEDLLRLRARADALRLRIEEKDFSAARRKMLAAKGWAMPDGSYPIDSMPSLMDAVQAWGRESGDRAALKAHLLRSARRIKASQEVIDRITALTA